MPKAHHHLPRERPAHFGAAVLLALRGNPPRLGAWAMEVRSELFGREVLLWPTPNSMPESSSACAILRGDQLIELDELPASAQLEAGDRILVAVEAEDPRRVAAYIAWLLDLATDAPRCSLAPYSRRPAGTHRLWLVGVARLALPASIRVEARHDLLGIRLAQVALGFGADSLSGPLAEERHLPVAGVTRPDEASLTGLQNLIDQAGLDCVLADAAPA